MDVRGFSMCSRLGANAPIYLVLINTLDKNEIITYNIDINKNRGMNMEENKNKNTLLVWWMIAMICWIFLRIGTDIYKRQKNDELYEKRASEFTREASERASEFTREASERASERARDLEKLRQEFRDEFGEEPSF